MEAERMTIHSVRHRREDIAEDIANVHVWSSHTFHFLFVSIQFLQTFERTWRFWTTVVLNLMTSWRYHVTKMQVKFKQHRFTHMDKTIARRSSFQTQIPCKLKHQTWSRQTSYLQYLVSLVLKYWRQFSSQVLVLILWFSRYLGSINNSSVAMSGSRLGDRCKRRSTIIKLSVGYVASWEALTSFVCWWCQSHERA